MRPVVYPSDWLFRDPLPPLTDFGRRFLSEGDSWFTIGTVNLTEASNLLFKLEFGSTTAIVNCAYPGDTLQHMVDNVNDVHFDRLLRKPRFASYWEAILFSAGGNDLIDAAQAPALGADGKPAPLDTRILLTAVEAQALNPQLGGPERYISEAGWSRLAQYITANFQQLVERRDQGPSRDRPLFLHTYAAPVARPAGTLGAPSGWLYPALRAYGIPDEASQAVVDMLFERLRQVLLGLDQGSSGPARLPHVHVFDSSGLSQLTPAVAGSTGSSGDWVNEIHPSPSGYAKIGSGWGAWIDQVLAGYP